MLSRAACRLSHLYDYVTWLGVLDQPSEVDEALPVHCTQQVLRMKPCAGLNQTSAQLVAL